MKKITFCLLIILIGFNVNAFAQDANKTDRSSKGFRIHSMYVGLLVSKPIGGLEAFVSSAGGGFKFGSQFYFYKPGFVKKMLNVGLQTQYLNAESNVPIGQVLSDKKDPHYSIAASANLGPVVSFKPTDDMKLDLYYMFGTGFRIFPKYDEGIYFGYENPANPHTRFTQSVGLAFHYNVLYVSLGLQMLSYKYLSYSDNKLTDRKKFSTFQVTIGTCGWKVKE